MKHKSFWSESDDDLDIPAPPPVRARERTYIATRIHDGKTKRVRATSLQDAAKQLNRTPHRIRLQLEK